MPHALGAYLGSVRCIADVRLRCVVDDDAEGGCWHLRTAHGKPQPLGRVQRVWLHLRGSISANGQALATGDAALLAGESQLALVDGRDAEVLVFDLCA